MIRRRWPVLVAVVLTWVAVSSAAGEVRILRAGQALDERYSSISGAVRASKPGDTIEVGEGRYVETVKLMGVADLVIRGASGERVVISPPSAVEGWERATAFGSGVFRAPYSKTMPHFGYVTTSGSASRLFIYNGICRGARSSSPPCGGPKGKTGIPRHQKRSELDALANLSFGPGLYFDKERRMLFLKLREGARPEPRSVHAAGVHDRALYIGGGSQRVALSNLEFAFGGKTTVAIEDASDILVQDSTVLGGRFGIWIDRPASGVTISRSVVRGLVHADPHWSDWKSSAAMEGTGIYLLRAGRGNTIADNHIVDWFDGVAAGHIQKSSNPKMAPRRSDNAEIRIRNNLIEGIYDDALEIEGFVASGEISGNLIRNALVGIAMAARFGAGDLYVYRNRVFTNAAILRRRGEEDAGRRFMRPLATKLGIGFDVVSSKGPPGIRATENVNFYHNTFVSTGLGLAGGFANQARAKNLPERIRWFDNIFVTQNQSPVVKTGSASLGVRLDGNLYWQASDWMHNGEPCKKILVRDWNTVATDLNNRFCGLMAARKSFAEWETLGAEGDPMFVDANFQSLVDTPRSGSPAINPPASATPSIWPDEAILLVDTPDRGAIELSSEIGLNSVEPEAVDAASDRLLVVRGSGFDATTKLTFGGKPATGVELISTTTIFAKLPEGLQGAGRVTVAASKGEKRASLENGLRLLP